MVGVVEIAYLSYSTYNKSGMQTEAWQTVFGV